MPPVRSSSLVLSRKSGGVALVGAALAALAAACATGETSAGLGLGGGLGSGASTASSSLTGHNGSTASTGGAASATSTSTGTILNGPASSTSTSSGAGAGATVGSSGAGASTTASSTAASTAASSGGACTNQVCDLVPQCGCPSGEGCSFAAGATKRSCQPAGSLPPGAACTTGGCAAGSICLGVCVAFCASDSDCAATSGICALQLSDGMGGSIPDEMLCTMTCDPTTNAGCPTGTGCQVGTEPAGQMRTFTFCETVGTKGKGQTCTTSSDCKAEFDCVNDGTSDECLRYCYVNNPSCATCTALTDSNQDPIYLGSNQVGVCP